MKDAEELQKAESAVKAAETKLASIDFDEKKAVKLADRLQAEEKEAQHWQERVQKLQAQLSALDFQFKNPESGFDRSRVKGVVAKLLRVQDVSANSALEVIAGGKLYQVVVDTADCAKALLQKGQLRNRVTIIPLDKINSRTLSQDKIKAAKQQVGDKAKPAISLVGYENELASAMKYVFGNAFVCKDAETAKTVTYSKLIGAHSATLDGDFYDPAGTLSGGSSKSSPSILSRLHSLTEAEKKYETHQVNVTQLRQQLDAASKQYNKSKGELDLKLHSLNLLKKKIDGSECTQLMNHVTALEESLQQAQTTRNSALESQTKLEESVKQLEKEVSLFGKEQKRLIKLTERKVKKCVASEKKEKELMEKAMNAPQDITVEIESSAADRKRLAEQITQADATIAELHGRPSVLRCTKGPDRSTACPRGTARALLSLSTFALGARRRSAPPKPVQFTEAGNRTRCGEADSTENRGKVRVVSARTSFAALAGWEGTRGKYTSTGLRCT